MQICPYCGAPIPANGRFCPKCGVSIAEFTPPAAPDPTAFAAPSGSEAPCEAIIPTQSAPNRDTASIDPADSPALQALRMHLHQESKAWRYSAIGVLVLMMFIAGMYLLFGGIGAASVYDGSAEDMIGGYFLLSFFTVYGIVMTISLLPVVIMGFVMGSKVHRYWEESATNCSNALKHAGSVGVIVLGAFFSTPALVFIIINFSKTKKNRAELEAVLARQQAGTVNFHG